MKAALRQETGPWNQCGVSWKDAGSGSHLNGTAPSPARASAVRSDSPKIDRMSARILRSTACSFSKQAGVREKLLVLLGFSPPHCWFLKSKFHFDRMMNFAAARAAAGLPVLAGERSAAQPDEM